MAYVNLESIKSGLVGLARVQILGRGNNDTKSYWLWAGHLTTLQKTQNLRTTVQSKKPFNAVNSHLFLAYRSIIKIIAPQHFK